VVLVGAGPGPADLVTVAGAKWLSMAEVIIYDCLAGERLLERARDDAQLIYVGKTPGWSGATQEQINAMMIEHCRAGRLVVRLKGGDGLIFARAGEEIRAMDDAGCAYRIVPGVTAASAAGASTGIALTDRRAPAAVVLANGNEEPTKDSLSLDFRALSGIETIVFYTGLANVDAITSRLLSAGRDGATPAAVIERPATPRQRTVVATLGTLAAKAEQAAISPPGIIIVGDVVAMCPKSAWFESLPLFGRAILVTRRSVQASQLSEGLTRLGAEVIPAPIVAIEPAAELARLDAALARLHEFDWMVLTSPNGAEALIKRMEHLALDGRALSGVKVAAVDLVPRRFTTESLGEALRATGPLRGKRILLLRSDIAPTALAKVLGKAGATVEGIAGRRQTCRHRSDRRRGAEGSRPAGRRHRQAEHRRGPGRGHSRARERPVMIRRTAAYPCDSLSAGRIGTVTVKTLPSWPVTTFTDPP